MVFKNFRFNLIFRIILLTVNLFVFVWLLEQKQLTFTMLFFALLAFIQIVLLIKHLDKTNQILDSFLQSIRYSDFSRTFQIDSTETSLNKLKATLNEVIQDFQTVKAEKEESYHYLQTVIQHIGIALIAYHSNAQKI